MVGARPEITKTDACGQEIVCLPFETDSIIGVKLRRLARSAWEIFTTEGAEDAEILELSQATARCAVR